MYLIDSANVKTIKNLFEHYSFAGVTTNPALMAKENRTDFLHHLRDIQKAMPDKRLYVQINAEKYEDMVREVASFKTTLAEPFTIKIPTTKAGYKLMRTLHHDFNIAATGVVDFHQGIEAVEAGAHALIIYVDRMLSHGHNPYKLLQNLSVIIQREKRETLLIGASFKTAEQIEKALLAGANQVTVPPALLENLFLKPLSEKAVKDFTKSFQDQYNVKFIK